MAEATTIVLLQSHLNTHDTCEDHSVVILRKHRERLAKRTCRSIL